MDHVMARMEKARYDRICILPLYAQYASATTGSTLEKAFKILSKWYVIPEVVAVSQYWDFEGYLKGLWSKQRCLIWPPTTTFCSATTGFRSGRWTRSTKTESAPTTAARTRSTTRIGSATRRRVTRQAAPSLTVWVSPRIATRCASRAAWTASGCALSATTSLSSGERRRQETSRVQPSVRRRLPRDLD